MENIIDYLLVISINIEKSCARLNIKQRRMTKQRKTILDEIIKVKTHPTADDIYSMVRKKIPHISMGTVYRNLEVLTDMDLIRTLMVDGIMHFDANTHEHYHIRCVICGKMEDLEMNPNEKLEKTASNFTNFTITGHKAEFFGICPVCKSKESKQGKE